MHAHMLKLHVKITSKKYIHLDLCFAAVLLVAGPDIRLSRQYVERIYVELVPCST
jgi:hypothetical protein